MMNEAKTAEEARIRVFSRMEEAEQKRAEAYSEMAKFFRSVYRMTYYGSNFQLLTIRFNF